MPSVARAPRRLLASPSFTALAALGVGLGAAAVGALGCNSVTGVEEVQFDWGGAGGANTGNAGNTGTGNTGNVAQGGAGNTGTGATSQGGAGGTVEPVAESDAVGVTVEDILLYQGVERPLVENGAGVNSNVPVVAGRDALVRVLTQVDGGYDGAPVIARLFIDDHEPIVVTKAAASSSKSSLASSFNFDVPGELIQVGSTYRVELRQANASGATFAGARFPSSGSDSLAAESSGGALRITIVPVRYAADGSNRLPDTDDNAVAGYLAGFRALYPVADVELTVRSPYTSYTDVYANGYGWDTLLEEITSVRQQDNPPSDTYYYGAFRPASSLSSFCGGGCVAGLGFVGSPGDEYTRASIGLGYGDGSSVETALHEVGHNHGRNHAPCGGASGADGSYPYSGGGIGSWGFDLGSGDLINPSGVYDIMGYCYPVWISDYTYRRLFEHIQATNGAQVMVAPELFDRAYERAIVKPDGSLSWLPGATIHRPPLGKPVEVKATRGRAVESVSATFHPYDHLPGGLLVWPAGTTPSKSITVDLGQGPVSLTLK